MEISQLTPDLQAAATPVTTPLPTPVLPVPNALPPDQQGAPVNPAQAAPIAAAGTTPSTGPSPLLDKFHQGLNAAAAATPVSEQGKPGVWAKQILAGVAHMFGGIQTGATDIANAKVDPNSGLFGGFVAEQAAKNARLTAEDRDRAMIAHENVATLYQQRLLHQLDDKQNHEDIANGQAAITNMTTHLTELGLQPASVIASGVTEDKLQSLTASKGLDPTYNHIWPDGSFQPMDPKTGKLMVDQDGNPVLQKTFTVLGNVPEMPLTPENVKLINENVPGVKFDPENPPTMSGAQAGSLIQQAMSHQALQRKIEFDQENADIAKLTADQTLAQKKAVQSLGPDFTRIIAQSDGNLEAATKYAIGQHQIPEIVNGKPTGRMIPDPTSIQYAKDHPTALTDIVNAYGGAPAYQAVIEKERKDLIPDVTIKDLPKNEQEAAAQTSAAQNAYDTNPTPANKAALDRATGIQTSVKKVVQDERTFSSNLQKLNNEASKAISLTNELAKKGFDDIGKQWTDLHAGFAGALAQVNNTRNAIKAGADGNGLLTSMAPTMEVLGINHAAGISRISPQEATAAALPGGFAERWNAWATKAGTGKLTPQLAAEGQQLMNIIIQSKYDQALQSTRFLAKNAGIDPNQVNVMDINGQTVSLQSQIKTAQQGGSTVQLPPAAAGTVNIQDSKGGYHNIPQNGLATAQKRDPGLTVIQ